MQKPGADSSGLLRTQTTRSMVALKNGRFCALSSSVSWSFGREGRRRSRRCLLDGFSLTWTHPCSIRWIIGNLRVTGAIPGNVQIRAWMYYFYRHPLATLHFFVPDADLRQLAIFHISIKISILYIF